MNLEAISKRFSSTRFFSYAFFGALAAVVELASFQGMIGTVMLDYRIASPISFILAAITNYILQRKFTFRNKYIAKHKQFAVFGTIALGGLIINSIATIAYVEFLGLTPMIAKVGAILTALIYNYIMNKKITFGKMK